MGLGALSSTCEALAFPASLASLAVCMLTRKLDGSVPGAALHPGNLPPLNTSNHYALRVPSSLSENGQRRSKCNGRSEILATLKSIQHDHLKLSSAVDAIGARVDRLAVGDEPKTPVEQPKDTTLRLPTSIPATPTQPSKPSVSSDDVSAKDSKRQTTTSRIILTTYPGQSGIDPVPMDWGNKDLLRRGPVVVSRHQNTVRRRNAIGAHGGSYAIYHALAVASKHLNLEHRPDFTNTEPAANIGPHPQWADKKKIVSMDPLGHLAPWIFKDFITNENIDIRPTIAITKAHMKLPELEQSVRSGRLVPDGKICLNEMGEFSRRTPPSPPTPGKERGPSHPFAL
ncbi:GTP cyclohydrolase [Coccidioides immitis H538.4]|uniref:GTP cyclohydrolase n=1 Tax=Coccidioides immitis H538.4 TaxID=396776 RepID=A0A0J8RCJ7_COCIT|nr:GTP cyclohydrolase [Coccidioides immitis H538.4]